MKADLTRDTFDPLKHYTRVLMQQGRVQLDADWNEQAAILLRYLRALAADVIGPQGGPTDSAGNTGFAILPLQTGQPSQPVADDFIIDAGHYYVDGILCEMDSIPIPITGFPGNHQVEVLFWPLDEPSFQQGRYVQVLDQNQSPALSPVPVQAMITDVDPANRTLTLDADVSAFEAHGVQPRVRPLVTYLTQPDYPVSSGAQLQAGQAYLVYLDAWERLITFIQDDHIREVALGGSETTARAKLVCQVKVAAGTAKTTNETLSPCDGANFTPADPSLLQFIMGINHGFLKAMAKQDAAATDPCITPPAARYRGPQNQLYRVEVHRGGKGWNGQGNPPSDAPTFKWSRENGSVVFAIAGGGGTNVLTLETLGRDDRYGLTEGDWVEVQDDDYVLQNRATSLLQVQSIDRTRMTVTLAGTPDSNVGKDPSKHPLLRRWHQKAGDPTEGGLQLGSDNAALIVEGNTWLDLENGIKIQFQAPDPNQPAGLAPLYHTGDYWLIPARTATGDVEWPTLTQKDSQGNLVRVHTAKPPDGVTHHYAPLAVITLGNVATPVGNCTKSFGSLTASASARARATPSPGAFAPAPLADVAGLGEARANALAQSGIDSVEKLARATPEQVAKALKGTGVSPQHATDFIEKAKQLVSMEKKQ